MGEDVDDFVVRTKSKTDQIIRDYTAVASNAYQGVSVLDDNGNLRDTYSILLDISKIYKEIQEEDKKAGTNRAQALVETLGGKNRSNIASSILLNGDILEQVYNASKNESTGSAQKELNTYLDSVEGKTTQITNNLQKLSAETIDTEGFKTLLDLANNLLSVINSLAEAFGGLNLAISAIAGIQLQKHGLGKHNSFPESQLVNKMPVLLQRIIMPCVCK